jgi:subtilisin family serine protease
VPGQGKQPFFAVTTNLMFLFPKFSGLALVCVAAALTTPHAVLAQLREVPGSAGITQPSVSTIPADVASTPLPVLRYWVQFSDKGPDVQKRLRSPKLLDPALGWTERARQRRQRLQIEPSWLDLPVYAPYLDALATVEGLQVRGHSRWLNAASVEVADQAVWASLAELPFVESVQPVRRYRALPESLEAERPQESDQPFWADRYADGQPDDWGAAVPNKAGDPAGSPTGAQGTGTLPPVQEARLAEAADGLPPVVYGQAGFQVRMLRTDYLHEKGYRGAGMLIAVFDAGWRAADTLRQFARLRNRNAIADQWNFYRNNDSVYNYSSHGTAVLSAMTANLPGEYDGTAPDARFALYLTEVEAFERIIEEDFWLMGAERADMQGVDVINTSLGYTTFDAEDAAFDHTYADMDGNTTVISRAADWAASRGMLVVVSAGNQGGNSWTYISAPADADSALAVGAVDAFGVYAPFSSRGPSADGDVKPNVAAVGASTALVSTSGTVVFGNGTSFSAPLVSGSAACLWQAYPEKSNIEIMRAIESSGHQFRQPDDFLGYGIPDFAAAFHKLAEPEAVVDGGDLAVFPSPVQSQAVVYAGPGWGAGDAVVEVFQSSGQRVLLLQTRFTLADQQVLELSNLDRLTSGLYLLRVQQAGKSGHVKFFKH